jgi:hypothetical protein
MSAYVVNADHIAQLVLHVKKRSEKLRSCNLGEVYNQITKDRIDLDVDSFEDIETAIGFFLGWANCKSVDYRYGEDDPKETAEYVNEIVQAIRSRKMIDLELFELIKMCECLEYQCCEVEDYYSTDQHFLINRIKDIFIACLVEEAKQRSSKENPTRWEFVA